MASQGSAHGRFTRAIERRLLRNAEMAARELGPEITFHYLRHAFASIAAHRGVPLNVLSAVTGHSNVGVTQKAYVHLYGREEAEDAFRLASSV